MITRLVVFLGAGAYLVFVGETSLAWAALLGLIPGFAGVVGAFAFSVALLERGHMWLGLGVMLTTAIVFVVSNRQRVKKKGDLSPSRSHSDRSAMRGLAGDPLNQAGLLFIEYCRAYLRDECGLSEEQAQLLVLDPDLGRAIDQVKGTWIWEDVPEGDPDVFLAAVTRAKHYDHEAMARINDVLSPFAAEYDARESRILSYLESIGHPMGRR